MTNTEQETFWTDQAGPVWAAQMTGMDNALAPVLGAVLDAAKLQPGETVLDIGCGAGTSTFEAAGLVGPTGGAYGLDISTTLLEAARVRGAQVPNAHFVLADAQTHAFEADQFDCLVSRFGVMFFDDTGAAFANMAGALKPAGRLAIATWGTIADNPYFTMPAAVSKTVLGPVPKADPDAPGPFALRDVGAVAAMLRGAGFTEVEAKVAPLLLRPPGDAKTVAQLLCEIGPAQRALSFHKADDAQRAQLVAALCDALLAYQTDEGIRIPAAINIFTARKPS